MSKFTFGTIMLLVGYFIAVALELLNQSGHYFSGAGFVGGLVGLLILYILVGKVE